MNFVALFQILDTSQSTNAKREALCKFFEETDGIESSLAIELLTDKRRSKHFKPSMLRETAKKIYDDQYWLFEECYATVGDLSETFAILFANTNRTSELVTPVLASWYAEQKLLATNDPTLLPCALIDSLTQKTRAEAFLFLKLSTGGFRVGVSRGLVHEALARVTGIERAVIDERMMGDFEATEDWLRLLKRPVTNQEKKGRPFPFLLAHPMSEKDRKRLNPLDLVVEYKWDGIRCQLIKTEDFTRLWSRGDQDITEQFPDIVAQARNLPSGLILDGEILIEFGGQFGTFQDLQKRLNRKRVTPALLTSHPAIFRPYDLIRWEYRDIRNQPLVHRQKHLDDLSIEPSPTHVFRNFTEIAIFRDDARLVGAEGIMLKHKDGTYGSGRKSGLWWKWKLDPMTADCILIYAQAGHGRRAALNTDYTLATLNENGDLVPIAKAYSGLTNQEIRSVDKWIKANTIEKFGPVRQVKPQLVFEIGFEGIARSARHKSGIALRFPRILRWRKDVTVKDADDLKHFEKLLNSPQ